MFIEITMFFDEISDLCLSNFFESSNSDGFFGISKLLSSNFLCIFFSFFFFRCLFLFIFVLGRVLHGWFRDGLHFEFGEAGTEAA